MNTERASNKKRQRDINARVKLKLKSREGCGGKRTESVWMAGRVRAKDGGRRRKQERRENRIRKKREGEAMGEKR